MEKLLVSAATGAMGSLMGKLATMLSDEYKLLKGVRGDIEFLNKELEAMYAFLLTMSDVEQPDEQAKLRVNAVRDLSFDIEDNIDKFMLLVEPESSSKADGFRNLISKSKNLLTDMKTRYKIAKEVKDIKKQIKVVSERYARYKIDESSSKTRNVIVDPRLLALFKDASELVGIKGQRDELVKWLSEEGELADQLKVVSLVGYGGLGKTTLANQVYHKLGGNFECQAFVSISRNPDVMKILSSIFSQIDKTRDVHAGAGDQQHIINEIREFLADKRYIIVIDDIWDTATWQILNCAFVKNSRGCRIITTTRIIDVAKSCCSDEDLVYKMKPLSDAHSEKLFFKRIFGSEENCPSYLKGASKDILKKCGGLPLAINAVSSLLATRKTKEEWDQVRCSIDFARGRNPDIDDMNYILSLSYFDLPHHLRSCLLYMTLFPEDYKIERLRLVHRWISEGFVHIEDGQSLVELGETYFHELINRSLIEPVDTGYDGKAWGCRVHDIILDFLIYKSTKENFCTLLGDRSEPTHSSDNKVRRLSQMGNDDQGNVIRSHKLDLSHSRTFGTFVHAKQMPSLESKALRVLDLEGCCGLENHHIKSIGRFPQLRYLNIAGTPITELPEQIGDLRHLETLNAYCDFLRELPETVTRLQRLAHLSVRWRTKLPDSIGNMTNLQELKYIDVFKHSLSFVENLGKLTNLRKLRIKLDTDGIEGDKLVSYKEKLESSLRKLDARKYPTVCIAMTLSEKDGLEGYPFFSALSCIQEISLICGGRCRITKWLVPLVNLEKLYIYVKEMEKQDLEMIGSIPNLIELEIFYSKHKHHQRRISSSQQLQSFRCNNCKGLILDVGAMPKLPCLTRT